MLFQNPATLPDAVRILLAKDLMPTSLDSAGIRELDASLKNQSLFSAQTTNEYLLQKYRDFISSILHPATEQRPDRVTPENPEGNVTTGLNPTYARRAIKDFLAEIGYEPAPDDAGTIKDLSSDARIELVIKTNVQMAQGQGNWLRSQNAGVLDAFPADELFRLEDRVKKREWLNRFRLAGSQTGDPIGTGWTITPDERMIALKNHDIWNQLGSSENFDDALDTAWPPFAFNSGMWVRDISRAECQEIGLVEDKADLPKIVSLAEMLGRLTRRAA